MASSTMTTATSKKLLSGWERALLVLPALAGLVLGLFPLLLTTLFGQVAQFPTDDAYIFQLAGAATLGYGVALSLGLFQQDWLALRLSVIGVLVFNLASLYACTLEIIGGHAPYSVYVVLASSLLFVAFSSLLLVRHRGVPHAELEKTRSPVQIYLIVGAVAAGIFGVLPLFVPDFFTLFHLRINAPFIIRQAGAASLGYAVVAVLAQRAINRRELRLPVVMAAIFNGAGGLASLPYLLAGDILVLPWVIAPFGLLVLVVCAFALRQMMIKTAS